MNDGWKIAYVVTLMMAIAVAAIAQRVLVLWDKNPEFDIAGYRVHYGTNSRDYQTIVNAGNATNAIIDGLSNGVTYFFALTAYNTSNLESDYSNEIAHTVGTNRFVIVRPSLIFTGDVDGIETNIVVELEPVRIDLPSAFIRMQLSITNR